jgi:excisionase family DNA binding protein
MDKKLERQGLLTVAQAAQMLGLQEGTVRDWILKRKISYLKLNGKAVRIRPEVIERLLAESEVPALK